MEETIIEPDIENAAYEKYLKKQMRVWSYAALIAFVLFPVLFLTKNRMWNFYLMLLLVAFSLIPISNIITAGRILKKLKNYKKTGIAANINFAPKFSPAKYGEGPPWAARLTAKIISPAASKEIILKTPLMGISEEEKIKLEEFLQNPLPVYFSKNGKDYVVDLTPVFAVITNPVFRA